MNLMNPDVFATPDLIGDNPGGTCCRALVVEAVMIDRCCRARDPLVGTGQRSHWCDHRRAVERLHQGGRGLSEEAAGGPAAAQQNGNDKGITFRAKDLLKAMNDADALAWLGQEFARRQQDETTSYGPAERVERLRRSGTGTNPGVTSTTDREKQE